MLKKSLSTMLAMVLTITMTFITPMEVSATSDDNLIEEMNTSGLEVQFVDSLEDLDSDLDKIQAGELPSGNVLEAGEIPDIELSEENILGEEVRSSRADGISMAYSDQSVTVEMTGVIKAENSVSYIPVTLAPGDILQATLQLPKNADLDYDLLLYEFDNDTLGNYIKGSTLVTYMNTYPDGTTKTVDEAIAYINTDSVVHSYAVIVFPSKGYSATESFGLTISLDQVGYYDASEPNESPFDVKIVSPNTTITGNSLNVINDQDWFVIKTTGIKKMGFVVSENSYSVEVYYAVDNSMILVKSDNGVYNLSEGDYFIKVYNKNKGADFVSKDYSLNVLTYGEIPALMQVHYDGDMDDLVFNYHQGPHNVFQYTVYPTAMLIDMNGNRIPNVNVMLEWIGDTEIKPNNGHKLQVCTTDLNGYASFCMRLPQAHGIHLYKQIAVNAYDYDQIKITCGNESWSIYLYHMRER